MFFHLSKIAWFVLQPSNLLMVMAVVGAMLAATGRGRRVGRLLLGLGLGGMALFGFSPAGNLVAVPLEERFPAWDEAGGPPDGIIVLGGALVPAISAARDTVELNESAERLTAFLALARRYPEARLVFTGGSAAPLWARDTEADVAAGLFAALGHDSERMMLEDRSRNTWENAVRTRDLVSPDPGERWLLVTSAWHMPRAVGSFRAAGFPVAAYPVDYRTRGWGDAYRPFGAVSEGLRRIDMAAREWVGLVAYRLTGRSSALLPGP